MLRSMEKVIKLLDDYAGGIIDIDPDPVPFERPD